MTTSRQVRDEQRPATAVEQRVMALVELGCNRLFGSPWCCHVVDLCAE
ncbi:MULTISPECIES: hypothetical protein [Dermacoccus]|nr:MULTISPECIES: hypothetical protein [Dermacoccus]